MDASGCGDRYGLSRRRDTTRDGRDMLGGSGMTSDGGLMRRETVNAEEVLEEARQALFVMVGFIAVIWAAQVVNWAMDQRLSTHYGIQPRSIGHIGDIFSAPFLHASW